MENITEGNLGKPRRITKPWITKEVIEKRDDRKKKKRRKLSAAELVEYRTANRKVRNTITKAKNN